MTAARRALAVLPLAAAAIAATPAQAAEVKTLPCINYVEDAKTRVVPTMPIAAFGFTPGGLATFYTSSARRPTPAIRTSGRLDASGGLVTRTAPPSFTKRRGNLETFDLIAEDRTNPVAPIIQSVPFQVVRFGMTRSPSPQFPRQTVQYTARGFTAGKPVYARFRFNGVTRRTVSLGIAKGACGITSKRMLALPTKVRYGAWRIYVDQARKFSVNTRPQWIVPFEITRKRR